MIVFDNSFPLGLPLPLSHVKIYKVDGAKTGIESAMHKHYY
jgi:hypothetical protein